jgi:peptide subunit release factor RF-3
MTEKLLLFERSDPAHRAVKAHSDRRRVRSDWLAV